MTFIFYDTETSGLEPAFNQILQFAAIVTDDQFNILDEVDLRCRPRPHQLLSPGAMMVTNVGPRAVHDAPHSCYELAGKLREFFIRWSPATFVGYNSISFDESMLRHLFFQSLHPVYQTNTNGCSRFDILRLAHAVAEHSPDSIALPLNEKGRPSFRLGALAEANGIVLDNAHDALADVRATLALAMLLRGRAPDVWDALFSARSRHMVDAFLQRNEIFYSTDRAFKKPTILSAAICVNPANPAAVAIWDLEYDPDLYLDSDKESVARVLQASPRPIRVLRTNALPILLPLQDNRISPQQLSDAKRRARLLREHSAFSETVSRALGEIAESFSEPEHLEQSIYSGFPSRNDQKIMEKFHQMPWQSRYDLLNQFNDKRFVEFGERIIFAEQPEALPQHRRTAMEKWHRDRHSTEDAPWLTLKKAIEELDVIRKDANADQSHLIAEMDEYYSKLRNLLQ